MTDKASLCHASLFLGLTASTLKQICSAVILLVEYHRHEWCLTNNVKQVLVLRHLKSKTMMVAGKKWADSWYKQILQQGTSWKRAREANRVQVRYFSTWGELSGVIALCSNNPLFLFSPSRKIISALVAVDLHPVLLSSSS